MYIPGDVFLTVVPLSLNCKAGAGDAFLVCFLKVKALDFRGEKK
jgi:hypothetical protein